MLLPPRGDTVRSLQRRAGRGVLTRARPHCHPNLGVLASRTVRNSCLWFKTGPNFVIRCSRNRESVIYQNSPSEREVLWKVLGGESGRNCSQRRRVEAPASEKEAGEREHRDTGSQREMEREQRARLAWRTSSRWKTMWRLV